MNAILMVMVNNDILFIWIFPGELSSSLCVILITRVELSISIFPNRPKTLCPKSNGARWFFTTDARTLVSSQSPKLTSLMLMTVPTVTSPLASMYLWLPMTSFADKYPFFIMKLASTNDSVTSAAPVSKTKCKGNPFILH